MFGPGLFAAPSERLFPFFCVVSPMLQGFIVRSCQLNAVLLFGNACAKVSGLCLLELSSRLIKWKLLPACSFT